MKILKTIGIERTAIHELRTFFSYTDLLKKNILKTSETELNELESNLRIFQKKYRRVAIKELKKLEKRIKESSKYQKQKQLFLYYWKFHS